jgi:hypothetical protein
MGQHDYNLANGTGAAFRADLNNALTAVLTNNSSTVAPTTTAQTMSYADTSALVMNLRNAGDTAWIKVFKFSASTVIPYVQSSAGVSVLGSSIVQRTENNNFTKAQRGHIVSVTYASTVTLSFNDGNNFYINPGAGNLTVANPSSIASAVGQGGSFWNEQDGTGSRTVSFGSMWKFPAGAAPTATTTASAVDRVDYKVRNASTIDANMVLNVS